MSIILYYLDVNGVPHAPRYGDKEFAVAMKVMEVLRKQGNTHVIMSNEPADMVGKPGVDSVVDGKTPDGHVYDWSKAGRAGRVKRGDVTPVERRD